MLGGLKGSFDTTGRCNMVVFDQYHVVEPNTVIAVMQKGYLLKDRLLRPAMVMVSKAAS